MVFGFNRDNVLALLGSTNTLIPQGLLEFFDIIIMSLAIAYIFEGFLRARAPAPSTPYDPLTAYKKSWFARFRVDTKSYLISLYAIAPAVILHELSHKFVALVLGSAATFYASYGGLALGVLLRLLGSHLIFFVPGFVAHASGIVAWKGALIAFAGPFANLVLWGVSWYLLRNRKRFQFTSRSITILEIAKKINLFLFFFNMIPLPPFDGGYVMSNLFRMFVG